MLGSGMLIAGVPLAVTASVRAHREGKDRGFVRAAIVACTLAVAGSLLQVFVPGGILRFLVP